MNVCSLGCVDRSLDPEECWALLARTSPARLVQGGLWSVTVVAVDRLRSRVTVELGQAVVERDTALLEIGDQGPGGGWNVIIVVGTGPVVTVPRPGFDPPARRMVLEIADVSGIVFAPEAAQGPTPTAVAA
jgi:hypothetical protein